MSRRGERKLTGEDRILWAKVAKSVTPMPGRAADFDEPEEPAAPAAPVATQPPPGPAQPRVPGSGPPPAGATSQPARGLDRPTRAKLAKGRLAIEGKVDLHGLTQGEAHSLLLSFLRRAHADGRRHVLVVTGKGASLGSDGVLRRAVPCWFATPPFRALVGAHEPAARHHGGTGALYVRLRRKDGDGRE